MNIEDTIETLKTVAGRYGLKILFLDFTDTTLIARIGFSHEVFIQVYANGKKEKSNMALVVGGDRLYGIDKEGGSYHEHPFKNPSMHIDAEQTTIEDFVVKSLEFLKSINLL